MASGVNVVDLDVKRARYSVLPLRKYFKRTRPTVVLSVLRRTNLYAAAACIGLRGAPALHFREASPVRELDLGGDFQAALMRRLMRLAYKRASSIISNSELTRDDLVAYGVIEKGDSRVIPNPVLPGDFDLLVREDANHPWLNDPNIKVVLSVGRLYPQKNQRLLIQAFRIVARRQEQARLLILGEGPERGRLEEQISACGLEGRVELHHFVQNPFPYYAKAGVFVLTSDYEGFGNVLVEALSVGTPVVCSDCPGGPRAILAGGKYGRLVQQGDAVQTAEAVLEALSARIDVSVLQERAQEFSVVNIGKEYATTMDLTWKFG